MLQEKPEKDPQLMRSGAQCLYLKKTCLFVIKSFIYDCVL